MLAVAAMSAAFLVVGCSGGSGKKSAPTTTGATNATSPTTISPSHVVASLGRCPQRMPSRSLELNADIKRLDKQLVPVAALNVRICSYDGTVTNDDSGYHNVPKRLVGAGMLQPILARRLEEEANRLPKVAGAPSCHPPDVGDAVHFYFLTFANDSQQVHVVDETGSCSIGPYNGQFGAVRTTGWLNELRHYTANPLPDLRRVKWSEASLPARVCGGRGVIHLHDGQANIRSERWSRFPRVRISVSGAVTYGDIDGDGHADAVVPVWCDNGSGTADGQLAESLVVFKADGGEGRSVLGIVPTTQPKILDVHPAYFARARIARNEVSVDELWYGPQDMTCCPSGRVTTVWTYDGTTLHARAPTIVMRPTR
jgi:hypothetical protein